MDSILKPSAVFQFTTAQTHRVLGRGLENTLQMLPKCDVNKLYFVVPEHHFDSFRKQEITGTRVPNSRIASVEQLVLKVVLV